LQCQKLTVTDIGSDRARFLWHPPPQADQVMQYMFRWATNPEFEDAVAFKIASGGTVTGEVREFPAGTTVYASVAAENRWGKSDWSAALSFETRPVRIPDKPRAPRLVEATALGVKLSWPAVSGNGAPITLYVLQYSASPEMKTCQMLRVAPKHPLIRQDKTVDTTEVLFVAGLRSGQQYYFRLKAYNSKGDSGYGELSEGYTTRSDCPAKMSKPMVTPQNSFCLNVDWVPPADCGAMQGGFLTSYKLRYATEPDLRNATEVRDSWGLGTRATLRELDGGKTYYFQVAAVSSFGVGPWSDASDGFPMPQVPPIMRPTTSSAETTSIVLNWQPPCHRGAKIQGYKIMYSQHRDFEQGAQQLVVDSGDAMAIKVDGLEPNTTYFFRHCAFNSVGCSKWSKASEGIATRACPPAPPDPPRLDSSKPFELVIQWREPEFYRIPVVYYVVRLATNPEMENARNVPTAATTQKQQEFRKTRLKIRGLRPNEEYYFQVGAVNQIGASDWSVPSAAMRTREAPPAQTTPPECMDTESFAMVMQWREPDCYGNPIELYQIQYSRFPMMLNPVLVNDLKWKPSQNQAAWIEAKIIGLEPGSEHYFQVRAKNSVGFSEWSDGSRKVFTLPDRPRRPRPITAELVTTTTIQVQWEMPHDSGSPLTSYELRYATNSEMYEAIYCRGLPAPSSGVTSHSVTKLDSKKHYYFQLRSSNVCGFSEWSSVSMPFQPVHDVPAKLAAPYLTKAKRHSLTVTWTSSADFGVVAGGRIKGYRVRYSNDMEALRNATPSAMAANDKRASQRAEDRVDIAPGVTMVDTGTDTGIIQQPPITVDGLLAGERYFFQVYAISAVGLGLWSDLSEPLETHPDAPEKVEVIAKKDETPFSIGIKWQPPRHNGARIMQYLVRHAPRSPDLYNGNCSQEVADPEDMRATKQLAGWCTFSVGGLDPGTEHCFQIAAVNKMGQGPWSEATSLWKTEPTCPGDIPPPRVVGNTAFGLEFEWDEPANNGEPVTNYTFQWSTRPGFDPSYSLEIPGIKEAKYAMESLKPGVAYFYRVAAWNIVGRGKYSAIIPQVPGQGRIQTRPHVPNKCLPPYRTAAGPTSCTLQWQSTVDNGSPIVQYVIRYATNREMEGAVEAPKESGTRRVRVIEDLEARVSYYFQVCARNEVGRGEWSNPSQACETQAPRKPSAPAAPHLVTPSSGSLLVGWFNPSGNGATVDTITLRVADNKLMRDPREIPDVPAAPQQFEVDELTPGETYYMALSATNVVGSTGFSTASQAMTTLPAPPDSVDRLIVHEVHSQQLTYRWVCPPGNGQTVTSFRLRYVQLGGDMDAAAITDIPATTDQFQEYTVADLLPGTPYYAEISASNPAGDSPWTASSSETGEDKGQPTRTAPMTPVAPLAVACSGRTAYSLMLQWSEPHHRGAPVTGYELRWERSPYEKNATPELVASSPVIAVDCGTLQNRKVVQQMLDSLEPGDRVAAQVRASNSVGWSEWSDLPEEAIIQSTFTVDAMHPLKPQVPKVVAQTPFSMTFEMVLPIPRGAPITGIQLRVAVEDIEGRAAKVIEVPVVGMDHACAGQVVRHEVGELSPGVVYVADCQALNRVGLGPRSDPSTGSRTDPHVPYRPAAPFSDIQSPHTIELRWVLPYENGAPVTKADIQCFHQAETDPVLLEVTGLDATTLMHLFDHLESDFECVFRIRCANVAGYSDWSPVSTSFVTRPTRPGMPENLQMEKATPTDVTVSWVVPDDHGAKLQTYDFVYTCERKFLPVHTEEPRPLPTLSTDPRQGLLHLEVAGDASSVKIPNLVPGFKYFGAIRAHNCAGVSDWGIHSPTSASWATASCEPEAVPPPTIIEIYDEAAFLELKEPYNNGSAILGFNLYWARVIGPTEEYEEMLALIRNPEAVVARKEQELCWKQVKASVEEVRREKGYRLEGLEPGTTYKMRYEAFNGIGSSPCSPEIEVLTEAGLPDAPDQLRNAGGSPIPPAESRSSHASLEF